MNTQDTIYSFERAVLSAFLFDPTLLESVNISKEDFTYPFHKNVFCSMQELLKEGKPIEESFVIHDLKNKGIFDEVAFLDILAATPVSTITPYISEIKAFSANQHFSLNAKLIISDETLSVEEKMLKLKDLGKRVDIGSSLPKPSSTKDIQAESPFFYLRAKLPIQKNEITLITGRGGTGKSYVSIWLAATLAKEEKLRVFAYLSEDTLGNTKNRLETVRKANPFLRNADFDYWGKEVRPAPFLKKTQEGFSPSKFWYNFTARLRGYDIVILDPLIAFIAEDENSNVEARALFNLLNEWCEKEDKTLIILHHHNKDNKIRGASAFVDAIRLHFTLENREENPRSRFLIVDKANHYAGANEFEIRLFKDSIKPQVEIVYEEPEHKQITMEGNYERF